MTEGPECVKCDDGILVREDENSHFCCDSCGAMVAPEYLRSNDL